MDVLRHTLGRRAWMGLVGVLAALVPLAAMEETGSQSIAAAASPTTVPVALRTAQEDLVADISYRPSIAHGTPNAGSLAGGNRLPIRGTGYYTYNPQTGEPPGGPERRFGTELLVRNLVELGEWWARTYPNRPRLGIGDLSNRDGGPFRDAHLSHQNGLDVDIRLPRKDGVEGAAHPGNYDRELTQAVIDRAAAQGAELILVGPNLDVHGPVTIWPNHDDHLHVRWPDPDGRGN
jgi:Penicillin-insensitive murein endopeptidase